MINDPQKTKGNRRNPKWRKVRKEFLLKNPFCAGCGGKTKLEVHHIKSFHEFPELELEESNLIVLCESESNGIVCHRFLGHLGSYRSINKTVRQDAERWREKIKNRP